MQFSYAVIASLLASVAYSQTIASEVAQIPSCALSCLTTAISGAGCGLTDYVCQCGSGKNAITASAVPCLASACSTSDTLKVQSITTEICVLQAASGSGSGSSSAASVATSASTSAAAPATSSTSSAVSAIGSFVTTATSAAAGTVTSSTSSSTPAQVTSSPGDKLHVGGVLVGAAALFALVL